MPGVDQFVLPDPGRDHSVMVDGVEWPIRPRFSAVLQVDAVVDRHAVPEGEPIPSAQYAEMLEACVEHFLTADQREAFGEWRPQRQAEMAAKLWRIYNELRSGKRQPEPGEPALPSEDEEAVDAGPDPT